MADIGKSDRNVTQRFGPFRYKRFASTTTLVRRHRGRTKRTVTALMAVQAMTRLCQQTLDAMPDEP